MSRILKDYHVACAMYNYTLLEIVLSHSVFMDKFTHFSLERGKVKMGMGHSMCCFFDQHSGLGKFNLHETQHMGDKVTRL